MLLATGSVPRSIPGLEIDHQRVITSDDALKLDGIPESVVILGAGAIGCEFASVWRSFGAEVTIVEALPHLVPLEEESSSKLLERAFRKRGIKQELGARFESVDPDRGRRRRSRLEGGKTIEAELLLVAIGRGPVSKDLGYEQVGVDDEPRLRRGRRVLPDQRPHDQRGRRPHPHAAAGARRLRRGHPRRRAPRRAAGGADRLRRRPARHLQPPRGRLRRPDHREVAKERGYDVVEATYDLAGNGKARILGTAGAVKVIASKDGPVLGVHMVGERVGELIAEAQLITNWEALPGEVAQLIHPHPTMSEAVGEAHLALAGKPLHSHS